MKEFLRDFQNGMANLGFRKRKGQFFTKDLNPDFLGIVGLNQASYGKGVFTLCPIISIRCQQIENLVTELTGREDELYWPPTIHNAIGYIMPEKHYEPWSFGEGNDATAMSEMLATVEKYGIPFMLKTANLEAVAEALEEGMANPDTVRHGLPVAYYLLEQFDKAEKYLDKVCEGEYGKSNSEHAIAYKRFAAKLLSKIRSRKEATH